MFSEMHHVAIIASDYQRAKSFYVDKLGFKVIREHHRPEKTIPKLIWLLAHLRLSCLSWINHLNEQVIRKQPAYDTWLFE